MHSLVSLLLLLLLSVNSSLISENWGEETDTLWEEKKGIESEGSARQVTMSALKQKRIGRKGVIIES